jgi:hypothetical protein
MKDGLGSSYLFGVSLNYQLINNLKDLKSVNRYSSWIIQTDSTQNILQFDKISGYLGHYSIDNALNLNIDAYLFPQIIGGQIGFGGYIRSQLTGDRPRNNLGFGAIIGQKDAPTNIVIGVLYQFNDVFNQLDKENEFLKRGGINLIAGFKF